LCAEFPPRPLPAIVFWIHTLLTDTSRQTPWIQMPELCWSCRTGQDMAATPTNGGKTRRPGCTLPNRTETPAMVKRPPPATFTA
jgi:hypothetical protein